MIYLTAKETTKAGRIPMKLPNKALNNSLGCRQAAAAQTTFKMAGESFAELKAKGIWSPTGRILS